MAITQNLVGNVDNVSVLEHAALVETESGNWGGYTLGNIITVNAKPSNSLVEHEFGHVLQSEIVGEAYLTGVALPSLGSAVLQNILGRDTWDHSGFWTETTADALSGSYFRSNGRKP